MKILWVTRKGEQWLVMVDDSDYAAVLAAAPWHVERRSDVLLYVVRNQKKPYSLHRFLMGVNDPKVLIDHKNRNGLDNRRLNIRIATRSQNNANGRKKAHSSRFRGVYWNKSRGKWRAEVRADGKKKHLGYFPDEKQAALARDRAARELFGPFTVCNFAKNG